MTAKRLIHNARILTQADGLVVDSIALNKGRIEAIGRNLEHDPDFKSYRKIDLKRLTVTPGFVDAHTHFYFMALAYGRVSLVGLDSMEACLETIRKFAAKLKKHEWVVGEGFELDRFKRRVEPNRLMLDNVTGGRPAFFFSKDQHMAWVNSRALKLAGITRKTRQPVGGEIVCDAAGEPTGILLEGAAYLPVHNLIGSPTAGQIDRFYRRALKIAHQRGVTGVHSFDGPSALAFFTEKAEKGRLGLRINHYPGAQMLPKMHRVGVRYGAGDEFLRIAGVKIFADGSLGSQTALCFNKYPGGDNRGIETTSPSELRRLIKSAARLGLPCAVHAIGDRAVANVIDAFESSLPLKSGGRYRIEHLQMIRRKDIPRLKRHGIVASMQPSHCPADIDLVRKYWGARGRNAYVFKTLIDRGINLAFGSDAPIEPLDPLAGMAAAVRRSRPGRRDLFYTEQRITAAQALNRFTVGPAFATGQEHCRGYILPGYPADLVVLSDDVTRVAASAIARIEVLATIVDGRVKHCVGGLNL